MFAEHLNNLGGEGSTEAVRQVRWLAPHKEASTALIGLQICAFIPDHIYTYIYIYIHIHLQYTTINDMNVVVVNDDINESWISHASCMGLISMCVDRCETTMVLIGVLQCQWRMELETQNFSGDEVIFIFALRKSLLLILGI